MGVVDFFIKLARRIWAFIKHKVETILNFVENIEGFFKKPSKLKKLKENKDLIAISIKENLDNGNYNTVDCLDNKSTNGNYKTVNCLFNTATNEVEDYEEALGIESKDIDSETEQAFGDKTMIILE